jgi:hypothetical protein
LTQESGALAGEFHSNHEQKAIHGPGIPPAGAAKTESQVVANQYMYTVAARKKNTTMSHILTVSPTLRNCKRLGLSFCSILPSKDLPEPGAPNSRMAEVRAVFALEFILNTGINSVEFLQPPSFPRLGMKVRLASKHGF